MFESNIIFAPITARGGAIFVIRISGEGCLGKFFENIKTDKKIHDIKEKYAHLLKIFYLDEEGLECQLDEVIFVYFKGKKSFTGEDTIEISLHGGNFIIDKFLQMLNANPGFRLAKNGEFTRRAFLNGKIDLLIAESINSMIKAENRNQHLLSSKFFSGDISEVYQGLRVKIINLLSKIEVFIDFPDEDIPKDVIDDIAFLKEDIEKHLQKCQDLNKIHKLQNAIKLGFFGNANCGKSSLLNRVSKRELAIVSNIKGTTRDVLTNEIQIKDEKVILCDTAGIRNTKNIIEQEGIKRTLAVLNDVDIRVFLFDARTFLQDLEKNKIEKILEILEENIKLNKDSLNFNNNYIILMTKLDLIKKNSTKYNQINKFWENFSNRLNVKLNLMFFSVLSEEKLQKFEEKVFEIIKKIKPEIESSLILNERHFLITKQIEEEVSKILLNKEINGEIELIAEDLRNILFLLQEITGEIKNDDILDKIFRDFCLGK